MGRVHAHLDDALAAWLVGQPVFFVATAPDDPAGLVNCSPKGNRGEFAVVDDHTVAYLDQTGSGVETIAHARDNGRIVVMFCAFDGKPRIVRLHGRAGYHRPGQDGFDAFCRHFAGAPGVGVRAIITVDVSRIADSCGYGVPFLTFEGHRDTMDAWATRKGAAGIARYQQENNAASIDGLPGLEPSDLSAS